MKEEIKKKMDECIKYFDFEKVRKVMEFLDWKWQSSEDSPSIGELVLYVQNFLNRTYEKLDLNKEESVYSLESGGFKLIATKSKDEIDFEVYFILEDWQTY